MDNLNPNINTGVLIREKRKEKAFVSGVNSPFDQMPDLVSSWLKYKTGDKRQSWPGHYDTNGCTNFGYTATIGAPINRLIQEKLIDGAFLEFLQLEGYLDAQGNFNASEAALAFMSGLGPNGNYLDNVAEAARTKGLIPESRWDSDPSHFNSQAEWMRPVPKNLLDLAKRFLEFVDLGYHELDGGQQLARAAIKKAPLYIALCTCQGWQSDHPVKWCGITQTNHCVSLYEDIDPNSPLIKDSYPDFIKSLALDYQIPYLVQVFVIPKKKGIIMRGFKTKDSATIYILQDGVFVPVTSWEAFVDLGGSTNTIKTISQTTLDEIGVAQKAKLGV